MKAFEGYEERVRKGFHGQGFMGYINAELISVEPGACVIRVPYNENLTQQNGFFHGGITGTLADNSAGFAAYSVMKPEETPLTVEFKINLVNKAVGAFLQAEANVLKAGRLLKICESKVYTINEAGEKTLCAVALATISTMIPR